METTNSIVDRLRDYKNCSDADIDEAAEMLGFLLGQFQMYNPDMGGQHSYRFRNSGWPMNHLKGPNLEQALRNAISKVEEERIRV